MAGAALTLPLWLASCAPGSAPTVGSSVPAGATAVERAAPAEGPLTPIPQPQAPPPPTTFRPGTQVPSASPSAAESATETRDLDFGSATAPGVDAAPESGAVPGSGALPGANASVGANPSPSPRAPVPAPAAPSSDGSGNQTAAYYVLVDDGGAKGVRFGCNDSLAGIPRSSTGPGEPLPAAMRALLDGSAEPGPGLYNSLAGSTLTFLAGSFDGSTVTVYLSGTVRPGGACDIPRIEAQLTQTAVAAVGAIRAEIYINGVGLTEALSQK